MTGTDEPDIVMRWLTIALCLPLFGFGIWGLLMPRSYQKTLVGLSGRLPDQTAIAPFLRFVNGRYFVWLPRVFSLFPIGFAVALLRTVR